MNRDPCPPEEDTVECKKCCAEVLYGTLRRGLCRECYEAAAEDAGEADKERRREWEND